MNIDLDRLKSDRDRARDTARGFMIGSAPAEPNNQLARDIAARNFLGTRPRAAIGGVPCRAVRGADGRQRVYANDETKLGVVIDESELHLLEDAQAERQRDADGLSASRGVLLAAAIGSVLMIAAAWGIWTAGRTYERAVRTAQPHVTAESRSSLP